MDWKLVPNLSFGGIVFHEKIEKYLTKYNFSRQEVETSIDEVEYLDEEHEVYVFTENEKIELIISRKHCIFRGADLIGMKSDSVSDVLGIEPDEVDSPLDYGEGRVAYLAGYHQLGLMLTFEVPRMGDSYVSQISCSK